jgi:hypothetical protein
MKHLIALFLLAQALVFGHSATARAIYGANGNYRGYEQTATSGVNNVNNAVGQSLPPQKTDRGQTNLYKPPSAYQGTFTAPVYTAPNNNPNFPSQAPQVPPVQGR